MTTTLTPEISSWSYGLPTLQSPVRYHCYFYLSFHFLGAHVGKPSPSVFTLSCSCAVTLQWPAHFWPAQKAQQFFGMVASHSLGETDQEEASATSFCRHSQEHLHRFTGGTCDPLGTLKKSKKPFLTLVFVRIVIKLLTLWITLSIAIRDHTLFFRH